MNNLFITGISGFIGTNLVDYFLGMGNYSIVGHSRTPANVSLKSKKDNPVTILSQYSSQIFDELGIDTVIHLAGIAHDLAGNYKVADYDDVNYEQTKKIFDDFLTSSATKFIFLSSIKAVVEDSSEPVDETISANPQSAYGKSKRKAEEYILSREIPAGKNFYILRPCMVHGTGNKGNLNLLYKYIKTGMPYPLGAFENQRSFLSIDNLIFIVAQLISKPIASGIYHLADDGSLSTIELYKLIASTIHQPARVWNLPPALIRLGFTLIGKAKMLHKMTENMLVSNEKIKMAMGEGLPVSIEDGIVKPFGKLRA